MTPKLRFQEFTGNYNHNTFKDYVVINQGLQIAISERLNSPLEGAYFYITNKFLRSNSLKSYWVKNPPKSSICSYEDILMTRTGNTGIVVTDVQGVFHNNFFKIKYPSNYFNKVWLVEYLRRNAIQKQILRYAGTSTIPDLNHKDFYRLPLLHPSIKEQTKIANLLSILNSKINLLTKKKEVLETYKKGLMQKIFSQELRFKGENGTDYPEWIFLCIGQSATILKGRGISKADINELGAYNCIRYGEIYTEYEEVINLPLSKTNQELGDSVLSMKGDVLIPASGETAIDMATACSVQLDNILIGADINIVRLKNTEYSELLAYAFSNTHRNILARLAQGVSVVHLYGKHISSLTIPMPSSMDEAQKIKNLLSSISKLIIELSKEIERVNTFKKGLLQQMFV